MYRKNVLERFSGINDMVNHGVNMPIVIILTTNKKTMQSIHCQVTFKYESQLDTFTATNYTNGELDNEIVTPLRAGSMALTGWDKGHHFNFDNPALRTKR